MQTKLYTVLRDGDFRVDMVKSVFSVLNADSGAPITLTEIICSFDLPRKTVFHCSVFAWGIILGCGPRFPSVSEGDRAKPMTD